MTDINQLGTVHSAAARFSNLFKAQPTGASGPTTPTMGADALNLTGGAAPQGEYAQFVADTVALLNSQDVRQRFQAIINMTKMQPAEAVPLLQKAAADPNPQVQQLAQRALTVMQQMQGVAPAPGAAPATPAVPATPGTPAPAPAAPAAPGAPPAPPAAATPGAPATPGVPATPATPAQPATPPAPPAAAAPLPAMGPANATNAGPGQNTATVRALESQLNNDPIGVMRQISQFAESDRQEVLRVLLTYCSNGTNEVAIQGAIQTLQQMKAKEAVPYLEAITRQTFHTPDTMKAAAGAIGAITAPDAGTQPGANAQGDVYQVRSLEMKMALGGPEGAAAAQQLAQYGQSQRQEVLRVLMTVFHKGGPDTQTLMSALHVARSLNAKELVPYLQYLSSQMHQTSQVRDAAAQVVIATSSAQGNPQAAAPAAPAAVPPQAQTPAPQAQVPAQPAAQPAAQPGAIPGFLKR